MGRHFISYSGVDAADFALRLVAELAAGHPAWDLWLDKRELKPGLDWDEQIGAAIKACDSLLFVMTRDSVAPTSVCKREWTLALKYNKPVIPLRLHRDAELPFRLEPRQYVDFTAELEDGLARLRSHLAWLAEPAGMLQTLRDRLADALRGLSRTPEADRPRVMAEIAALEEQITRQQQIVEDPYATAPMHPSGAVEQRLPVGAPPRHRREAGRAGEPAREPSTPAAAPASKGWDATQLEKARQELAAYIGPMARLIVGRAAERASSLEELYQILAAEIGSPADRERFLASSR
jgi:hypothetical protein